MQKINIPPKSNSYSDLSIWSKDNAASTNGSGASKQRRHGAQEAAQCNIVSQEKRPIIERKQCV